MLLSTEISELAKRSLTALDESHDYYTFTKRVWRLLPQIGREGRGFSFRNLSTGTRVDEQSLANQPQKYITQYLLPSTFQQFVSLFEDYFFDFLRFWLVAYPGSLSRKQLEFRTVMTAADKPAIIVSVVEKELNELKYERPADWFVYLDRIVKLGCPSVAEIEQLAEIKASRDILAHGKGMANATYVAKAGRFARCKEGERLEITEPNHRASWELIKKVVQDLSDAAISRCPTSTT